MTAGLTCPPEMLAPMATATNRANPWQTATATSPAGSRAASAVNLSAIYTKRLLILKSYYISIVKKQIKYHVKIVAWARTFSMFIKRIIKVSGFRTSIVVLCV